ncbi:hypothetical protein D3C81_1782240 [compost metagenome]
MGHFQFDAQNLVDAQALGDGTDQVGARGRDHQDPVAGLAMRGDGFGGVTENDRLDVVLHPRTNQVRDFFRRTTNQRFQAEGHVVLHGQMAPAVGIHQFLVATQERLAIDPAEADHLLAPQ